jgi:hypothetical protein
VSGVNRVRIYLRAAEKARRRAALELASATNGGNPGIALVRSTRARVLEVTYLAAADAAIRR